MNPIDKFTDLEAIYNFVDKEDKYTDYVWRMAMLLRSNMEEDEDFFECSYAVPIFKQRYNERLIKMPLTYEEYVNNKDIQGTITGLGYDIDKFWFALLFIYDFCQTECFNSKEAEISPFGDFSKLTEIVNKNLSNGTNPLEENIIFSKDIKLEIKVANRVVHTIKTPNAIKYLADCSNQCCEKLLILLEKEENSPMFNYKIKDELTIESQSYHIFLFTRLFYCLFTELGKPKKQIRSRNSDVSYDRLFLISKLIYFTQISRNEELLYSSSTLKGYMSRCRNKGWKWKWNKIYNK